MFNLTEVRWEQSGRGLVLPSVSSFLTSPTNKIKIESGFVVQVVKCFVGYNRQRVSAMCD